VYGIYRKVLDIRGKVWDILEYTEYTEVPFIVNIRVNTANLKIAIDRYTGSLNMKICLKIYTCLIYSILYEVCIIPQTGHFIIIPHLCHVYINVFVLFYRGWNGVGILHVPSSKNID
jgi:hypothetical protein